MVIRDTLFVIRYSRFVSCHSRRRHRRPTGNQRGHVAHGAVKPDHHGAGDDGMADVQFLEVRHMVHKMDVVVVEAMACVDAETKGAGLLGSAHKCGELAGLRTLAGRVGKGAGVELDECRASFGCGGVRTWLPLMWW